MKGTHKHTDNKHLLYFMNTLPYTALSVKFHLLDTLIANTHYILWPLQHSLLLANMFYIL
jgi:hypothetical protein